MKKLISILLTLVMVICLINLNNNYTKANGENVDYTITYSNTGVWDWSDLPNEIERGKVIRISNQHATDDIYVNYIIDGRTNKIEANTSEDYVVNAYVPKAYIGADGQTLKIIDGISSDDDLKYTENDGDIQWYYNNTAVTDVSNPNLDHFGIAKGAVTTPETYILSKNLWIDNRSENTMSIYKSLNLELANNVSMYNGEGLKYPLFIEDDEDITVNINGNGHILALNALDKNVFSSDATLNLNNISLICKNDSENLSTLNLVSLNLGDNCLIEATNYKKTGDRDMNYALRVSNEPSAEVLNNYEFFGKADYDDEELKVATWNYGIFVVEGEDGTLINARYVLIKPKQKPAPTPDPGKKDESCEKVIGPTWHWNNDKGICEDYGVVGTYTR